MSAYGVQVANPTRQCRAMFSDRPVRNVILVISVVTGVADQTHRGRDGFASRVPLDYVMPSTTAGWSVSATLPLAAALPGAVDNAVVSAYRLSWNQHDHEQLVAREAALGASGRAPVRSMLFDDIDLSQRSVLPDSGSAVPESVGIVAPPLATGTSHSKLPHRFNPVPEGDRSKYRLNWDTYQNSPLVQPLYQNPHKRTGGGRTTGQRWRPRRLQSKEKFDYSSNWDRASKTKRKKSDAHFGQRRLDDIVVFPTVSKEEPGINAHLRVADWANDAGQMGKRDYLMKPPLVGKVGALLDLDAYRLRWDSQHASHGAPDGRNAERALADAEPFSSRQWIENASLSTMMGHPTASPPKKSYGAAQQEAVSALQRFANDVHPPEQRETTNPYVESVQASDSWQHNSKKVESKSIIDALIYVSAFGAAFCVWLQLALRSIAISPPMPQPFSSSIASDKGLFPSSGLLLECFGSLRALILEIISASWSHIIEIPKNLKHVKSAHPAVRSGTACFRKLFIHISYYLKSFSFDVEETRIEASSVEHARTEQASRVGQLTSDGDMDLDDGAELNTCFAFTMAESACEIELDTLVCEEACAEMLLPSRPAGRTLPLLQPLVPNELHRPKNDSCQADESEKHAANIVASSAVAEEVEVAHDDSPEYLQYESSSSVHILENLVSNDEARESSILSDEVISVGWDDEEGEEEDREAYKIMMGQPRDLLTAGIQQELDQNPITFSFEQEDEEDNPDEEDVHNEDTDLDEDDIDDFIPSAVVENLQVSSREQHRRRKWRSRRSINVANDQVWPSSCEPVMEDPIHCADSHEDLGFHIPPRLSEPGRTSHSALKCDSRGHLGNAISTSVGQITNAGRSPSTIWRPSLRMQSEGV